jgi:hypothetical protein
MAHERLRAKLKNQREFTQMAYFGGENAGGSAKLDELEINGFEMLVFPKS